MHAPAAVSVTCVYKDKCEQAGTTARDHANRQQKSKPPRPYLYAHARIHLGELWCVWGEWPPSNTCWSLPSGDLTCPHPLGVLWGFIFVAEHSP